MAELSAAAQSSLLLPKLQSHATTTRWPFGVACCGRLAAVSVHKSLCTTKCKPGHLMFFPMVDSNLQQNPFFSRRIGVIHDSKSSNLVAEKRRQGPDFDLDTSGGGGFGEEGSNGGHGGGDGGGGDDDGSGGSKGSGENKGNNSGDGKKANGLLMSQKFTLGYAALVGLGGVMGYIKGGSQKSLAAGGLSALLLYCVYAQLPTRPVLASSLGLGLSAALLVVMGSRFKNSGKIFPAGVVSLVSLVMSSGYLHGIMRAMH